jgi:peptide deformylase
MSRFDVLLYPHVVLRKPCRPIESIDDEVIRIARGMAEAMYRDKGVGLAAPQIGISRQVIVLDVGEGLITLLNPEIIHAEGSEKMEEGCLCLPRITVDVERSACVRVTGIGADGNPVVYDAEGLLARCFQHEIDHLQGKLIIDRVSKLKRDLALKQYRKLNDPDVN